MVCGPNVLPGGHCTLSRDRPFSMISHVMEATVYDDGKMTVYGVLDEGLVSLRIHILELIQDKVIKGCVMVKCEGNLEKG